MSFSDRNTLSIAVLATFCFAGCISNGPADLSDHSHVGFDISPNGEEIVFSSADGDLFLLTLDGKEVFQLTSSKTIETCPSFSPDGFSVVYSSYVGELNQAHIFHIDLASREIVQLTNQKNVCDLAPCFDASCSQIVFARARRYREYSMGGMVWDNWDVCVIDANGRNCRRITTQDFRRLNSPGFYSVGDMVIFAADWNGAGSKAFSTVFELPVSGDKDPKPVAWCNRDGTNLGVLGNTPRVSKDGKQIVFISDRRTRYNYDIYTIEVGEHEPQLLNVIGATSRNKASPVVSPNRKHMYFLAETGNPKDGRPVFELWRSDFDGQNANCVAPKDFFDDPILWAATAPTSVE